MFGESSLVLFFAVKHLPFRLPYIILIQFMSSYPPLTGGSRLKSMHQTATFDKEMFLIANIFKISFSS